MASANGRPEWEPDIRATFAERWIANARPGWYYKTKDGNWSRK
ncbi:MAG: YdbL family protein [Gemmatimonadetes bacterium]|nr:YdbL family protein [Gemmatimonadota bacterium]